MIKTINGGQMPTRATKHSAGLDVYANEHTIIRAGETKVIGVGVCIDMDAISRIVDRMYLYTRMSIYKTRKDFLNSHYLQILLRSSLGEKGLILPNGVGIIDMDFDGEISMIIHNPTTDYWCGADGSSCFLGVENSPFVSIKKGDRIGQLLLQEHKGYLLNIDTDIERVGGMGSTGG